MPMAHQMIHHRIIENIDVTAWTWAEFLKCMPNNFNRISMHFESMGPMHDISNNGNSGFQRNSLRNRKDFRTDGQFALSHGLRGSAINCVFGLRPFYDHLDCSGRVANIEKHELPHVPSCFD